MNKNDDDDDSKSKNDDDSKKNKNDDDDDSKNKNDDDSKKKKNDDDSKNKNLLAVSEKKYAILRHTDLILKPVTILDKGWLNQKDEPKLLTARHGNGQLYKQWKMLEI